MIEWIILAAAGAVLSQFGKKSHADTNASLQVGYAGATSPTLNGGPTYRDQVETWRLQWDATIDRTRWIPSGTAARIIRAFPPPERKTSFLLFPQDGMLEELEAEFRAHNEAYLTTQKERLKPFFASVEKNPLTDEQIDACVCMDDSVQIVAAAGSGKTSTMVAKAGYAIHEGLAEAVQILLLAFNKDAAEELKARINDRLATIPGIEGIAAETFHKFGLDVIGAATGAKPSLADWAKPGQDIDAIVQIVGDLSTVDADFRRDWNRFRIIYGRDVGRWDEPALPDAYANGNRGFRTANGEIVKSKEERLIADWLFYHGVTYQYEPPYEHETADERYQQYRPDFYYPDIELYHEHFALDRDGQPPDHFGQRYLDGVVWKRQLHADMGTALFETTSAEISQGAALSRLEAELLGRGLDPVFDTGREAIGAQPMSNDELARMVRVFQQHAKGNGLSQTQLRDSLTKQSRDGHTARLQLFLSLYFQIADEWERRLKAANNIDFEDMLLLAADHIETGRFKSPYKMVLSDEFQDSSRARIRILKALQVGPDDPAHLSVVGDDWQGINRFAGADVSVMSEFEKTFEHATLLTLNTTFRCPQSLCDISSAFVQANPAQIRKDVRTTNTFTKVSVLAYGFDDIDLAQGHLNDQLFQMHDYVRTGRLRPDRDKVSVLLLGRYQNDRPSGLSRWMDRYGDCLDIRFNTIHGSKGLEADYVMLLNVVEGIRGFPSQIEDDPILQIPMPAPDPFPMAEERRLFYVALTRAKRQVRIYSSLKRPSRFLLELQDQGAVRIEAVDGEALEGCPQCRVGVLRVRKGKFGDFQGCNRCDFTRDAGASADREDGGAIRIQGLVLPGSKCPTCRQGTMKIIEGKSGQFLGCSQFPKCKTTARLACPA